MVCYSVHGSRSGVTEITKNDSLALFIQPETGLQFRVVRISFKSRT